MEYGVDSLLARYRKAGVLVDTNLLLLYFVGNFNQGLIERWTRTKDRFVAEDFDTLQILLEGFERLVVTPHILTELSNWLRYLNEPARTECLASLTHAMRAVMCEEWTCGAELSENSAFLTFGITDMSILDAALGSYLVLTDDLPLYANLQNKGVAVLNFNEIRDLAY